MRPRIEHFFFSRGCQVIWSRQSPGIKIAQAIERSLIKGTRLPTRCESFVAADAIKSLVLWIRQPQRKIADESMQHAIRFQTMFVQKLLRNPNEVSVRVRNTFALLQEFLERDRLPRQIESSVERLVDRHGKKARNIFDVD